jgi:hypothetical protein
MICPLKNCDGNLIDVRPIKFKSHIEQIKYIPEYGKKYFLDVSTDLLCKKCKKLTHYSAFWRLKNENYPQIKERFKKYFISLGFIGLFQE